MYLSLDRALFLISTSLLLPVLAVLTILTGWSILLVGGFVQEWIARRTTNRWLRPRLSNVAANTREALQADAGIDRLVGYVPRYVRTVFLKDLNRLAADKRIDDIELEMAARLARLALVGRLGPMLGLAGTLIPLGPALVELARGNIAALATQLVVAFSATIIGLLIGMLAIAVGQARRAWYARDLSDIVFLEELRNGAPQAERP
jgi:biopolymer transport protein ExbB/TolQ